MSKLDWRKAQGARAVNRRDTAMEKCEHDWKKTEIIDDTAIVTKNGAPGHSVTEVMECTKCPARHTRFSGWVPIQTDYCVPHQTPIEGPRMMKCACGETRPSDPTAPFFENTGAGTRADVDTCKVCHKFKAPHEGNTSQVKWYNSHITDHTFVPHGPWTFDLFYCGHGGWD